MRAGTWESYHAITTLLFRYAECIDRADFAGLGALFAHGRIRSSSGPAGSGWSGDEVRDFYARTNRVHEDGTLRTRHLNTNHLVDIDEAAVQSAALNAQANGVRIRTGLPDQAAGRYPVVLANILATPLKMLAPLLCGHVEAGGSLVLAGILARQAGELQAAYAPYARLEVRDEEDGWILMTARR